MRQLADFEGAWQLTRRVTEAGGRVTEVTGRAVWRRQGAGLVCEETGEMRVPGHAPMQVVRRMLWGPGLSVAFEDGRHYRVYLPASVVLYCSEAFSLRFATRRVDEEPPRLLEGWPSGRLSRFQMP